MLDPAELANWLSLYVATAVMAAIAAALAIVSVSVDLYRERRWRELSTVRGAVLFAPKLWWRWQKRYLLATPVILAVVVYYSVWLGMWAA